jgi:hypothetical protein
MPARFGEIDPRRGLAQDVDQLGLGRFHFADAGVGGMLRRLAGQAHRRHVLELLELVVLRSELPGKIKVFQRDARQVKFVEVEHPHILEQDGTVERLAQSLKESRVESGEGDPRARGGTRLGQLFDAVENDRQRPGTENIPFDRMGRKQVHPRLRVEDRWPGRSRLGKHVGDFILFSFADQKMFVAWPAGW